MEYSNQRHEFSTRWARTYRQIKIQLYTLGIITINVRTSPSSPWLTKTSSLPPWPLSTKTCIRYLYHHHIHKRLHIHQFWTVSNVSKEWFSPFIIIVILINDVIIIVTSKSPSISFPSAPVCPQCLAQLAGPSAPPTPTLWSSLLRCRHLPWWK